MEKVSLLSRQEHTDRQRDKSAATPTDQASRLTHTIMNQLTIIYLSCAKLRRSLGPGSSAKEDSEIQIIESAVEQIAKQAETLRFRLKKTTRARVKARSKKLQKKSRSTMQLSFISPRDIEQS
jgi:nitrogen fixation/metabolism regulation signal transduction histidine kinase